MLRPTFKALAYTLFTIAATTSFARANDLAEINHSPKVLLVSDIDDTIKVSHVLNKIGKFARAVDATTPFKGMAQLYQLIYNQNPTSTEAKTYKRPFQSQPNVSPAGPLGIFPQLLTATLMLRGLRNTGGSV